MKKLIAAVALAVVGMTGVAGVAGAAQAPQRSQDKVQEKVSDKGDDCRTYSGVTVCGRLTLSEKQRDCVAKAVQGGLSDRRAEVECAAFR